MAEKVKIGSVERSDSVLPKAINSPVDCPTMIVDGMSGASISNYMVRLHMVEHVGYEADTLAKHVMTLAFDVEQFGKFIEALVLIREQMQPASDEVA